jgi:hypothetical protein
MMVSFVKEITEAADFVWKHHENITDWGKNSLTAFAKPTTIASRVYIDGYIFNEPVVSDILKCTHTLYTSFILNALQMNRLVTRSHTVKDLLNVVSNESYEDIAIAFENDNGDAAMAEKLKRETERWKHGGDDKEGADWHFDTLDEIGKEKAKKHDEDIKKDKNSREGNTGYEVKDMSGGGLPIGKMVEVTLANPEDAKNNVKLTLLIQLLPYFVSGEIAHKLITLDTIPNIYNRFIQWRTGEISFWKDFVFQVDIVKDRKKTLLEDKDNVLGDYLTQQQIKLAHLYNNLRKSPDQRKRNLASTVLVMSSQAMLQAKIDSGLDFKNISDRNKFFSDSFAMMVIVVDTNYNRVTMYYNGLDDVGEYTFDQMKVGAKKGDNSVDVITAMSAFMNGKNPRF